MANYEKFVRGDYGLFAHCERKDVNVFGSWCVTLPTHAPDLDENGAIIYEEQEVHHKDGTVTMENVPKMHEIY